jgi:hypothetical protein
VHDSQLAIPMEQLTEKKVPFCYSLMDSAYDSKVIDEFIRSHGRVPIIDVNKRKDNNRPPLDPAKKERYNIRTTVELANSHLKDSLIPRCERLQESVVRVNDCGNMPGGLKVPPAICLGVLEQAQVTASYLPVPVVHPYLCRPGFSCRNE